MLVVGTGTARRGFVVPVSFVLGRFSGDIERGLGFPPGKLVAGYYLLTLACRPQPHQFALRGHSDPENGLGESLFVSDSFRDAAGKPNAGMIKEQVSNEMGVTSGPGRIVKVVPKASAFPGEDWAPPPPAPQWDLLEDLPFHVVAAPDPGEMVVFHYDGSFFTGTPEAIEAEGQRWLAEQAEKEADGED